MILLRSVTLWLLLILFCVPSAVIAQCGSLVTYRQHEDLLKSAPPCLRDGCRQTQNDSTISSPCPSTSACSVYWNMFVEQFDQKHSWCSTCDDDLACRISGWPVMNATTLCYTTPNQLLYGDSEDGCCAQRDEPFELAAWTASLCNGSEWRKQFDVCGGMACRDWHEWIMPWNWTMQNNTRAPNEQNCTAPPKYLALYAGEHFFWLLTTFGVGYIRLRMARHEEKKNRNILRYILLSFWTGVKFRQKRDEVLRKKMAEREDLRPAATDKLRWGFPVIMGIFLAGLQLGFNFLAAHLMKSAPGYDDVPLALLALLLCCRPRLSWLSCLLALMPPSALVKIFKFREGGDGLWAAKLVLSSVAVTSAVTESILQVLGAYFLGRTAQIGAQRDFYTLHHLRPKMWGRDARHMYLGALFWLMLCIPLLIVWIIIAIFFSQVYSAVSDWRRSIFEFMNPKKSKLPQVAQGPYQTVMNIISPEPVPTRVTPQMAQINQQDQPTRYDPELPYRVTPDNPFDLPMPYGGPATGSLFDDQPIMVQHSSRNSPFTPSGRAEFTDQPLMIPRAASGSYRSASGGYTHSATAIQRRTASGGQYNSLSQNDDVDAIEPFDGLSTAPPRLLVGQQPIHRNEDASHTSLLPPQDPNGLPSSSGGGSSNQRHEYTDSVRLKRGHWEWKIIVGGAFLGMLAYASQWLFWDGFVKAAGDKFCPPSLWKIGGLWWSASILSVFLPFLA